MELQRRLKREAYLESPAEILLQQQLVLLTMSPSEDREVGAQQEGITSIQSLPKNPKIVQDPDPEVFRDREVEENRFTTPPDLCHLENRQKGLM